MKKYLVILLAVVAGKIIAQDSTFNSVQVGWGYGKIMRQDLTLSPFIHEDWSPVNFFASYHRSKKLEQDFAVKFSFFDPIIADSYEYNSFYNGDVVTLPHSFKLIDIDYALGKKILGNEKWSFIAGGKSRNFIYASDYYFGDSGPSPMFISLGLDFWLMVKRQISEKQYIVGNLSLPVFSFVYRDPYLAQDDEFFENIYSHNGLTELASRIEDSKLRSRDKAQRVEFNIRYGYRINRLLDVGLGYLFTLNKNQAPTEFTQIENIFSVNVTLKF